MRSRSTTESKSRWSSALALAILLAPSAVRAHFVGAHEAQLWGSPIETEAFGTAVAVDANGTRAFFGAPGHGSGDGRVLVFVRTGTAWGTEADVRVTATGSRFGTSIDVSADGTRMIVGAPYGGSGSARVLVRSGTTWTEEATLVASSPLTGGAFGSSVAMSPDAAWAVVGSPGAGVAEVFSRTGGTWSALGVITAATAGATEQFGSSVAIDATGTRVFVGAHLTSVSGVEGAGSAFVFRSDAGAWVEEAQFTDPSPVRFGQFGRSVAMDETGTRVLIGGFFSHAYVFARAGTTWTQEASLLSILLWAYQGANVSLDAGGTHAIVGLPAQDRSGRAHTFVRSGTTWSADGSIRGLGGTLSEAFGGAVAMSADATRVVVGAPDSPISGVGYVFASVGDPCVDGSTCPTGICAGGICCDSVCGETCVSCAAAETGADFDGICDTYSSPVSRTVVCRPATGVCDREETCVTWSRDCPSDAYARATLCRSVAGVCDLYEYCDGSGPECPADARRPAGTTCRSSGGGCDVAEVCDGVSADCPANVRVPAGTACRASTDPSCDPEEVCTGTSARCPTDTNACVMDAGSGATDAGASIDDAGASVDDAGASVDDASAGDADAGLDAAVASPDGGTDAGREPEVDAATPPPDAAAPPDGGIDATPTADAGPPTAAGGCTCRVVPGSRSPLPLLATLLAGVGCILVARRRRARRRAHPRGAWWVSLLAWALGRAEASRLWGAPISTVDADVVPAGSRNHLDRAERDHDARRRRAERHADPVPGRSSLPLLHPRAALGRDPLHGASSIRRLA